MHCLEHGKEWDIDRASGEESALQTREFEWDSLDDDTIEIMKKLETKKTVRHLGVFAKCDAPDTTETGRRVIRKVRMRIEDMQLRNRGGKVAVQRTNVLLVTVVQWNTLQAISPLKPMLTNICFPNC